MAGGSDPHPSVAAGSDPAGALRLPQAAAAVGARPRGRGGGINVLAPLAPASRWIGSETGINAASGRRGGIWVEERWKGRDEDGRAGCQRQLRPRSPRGRGGCAAARRHRALPSFLPDGAGRLRAPGPAAAPGARRGAAKSPAGRPGTEPPPPGRDAPVARGHPSAAGSAGADAERSEAAAAAAATDGAGGDTAPAKRGSAAAPPAAPPAARHGTARHGGAGGLGTCPRGGAGRGAAARRDPVEALSPPPEPRPRGWEWEPGGGRAAAAGERLPVQCPAAWGQQRLRLLAAARRAPPASEFSWSSLRTGSTFGRRGAGRDPAMTYLLRHG